MARNYNFVRLKSDTYFMLESYKKRHQAKSFDQAIRSALKKASEEAKGGAAKWI